MNTNHISELWKASLVIGPVFAILFGLSINSLYLGLTKYDACPFEPFLPQGLIGFGLLGSIFSIAALSLIVFSFFQVDDSGTHLSYMLYAFIALVAYGLNAIILAFVIAFLLYTKISTCQSEDSDHVESFCHSSVYNYCYNFAVTGVILVLTFSIWLIRTFFAKMKFFT